MNTLHTQPPPTLAHIYKGGWGDAMTMGGGEEGTQNLEHICTVTSPASTQCKTLRNYGVVLSTCDSQCDTRTIHTVYTCLYLYT